jgi:hypothetical protein
MENEAPLPRPIDNGQVDQTVVEYTGGRLGAVTYRGPTGREHRFDAGPSNKRHYVLDEDLEYFRCQVDFRVLEETRIDPEAEKLRALVTDVLEQRGALVSTGAPVTSDRDEAPERPRPPRRRGGRPAGRGFGAMLDCWMTCGRLGEYYGTAREAYDAIDDYLQQQNNADQYIPPRERFPSVRSDAKRKREKAGRCLWHNHPGPVPPELISG